MWASAALGGRLQLRAGRDLGRVGGRDLDRLTRLRVAPGAGGPVGLLDAEEPGQGDLVAGADRVHGGVGEPVQHGPHVGLAHAGGAGDRIDQLALVHYTLLGLGGRSGRSRNDLLGTRRVDLTPQSQAFRASRAFRKAPTRSTAAAVPPPSRSLRTRAEPTTTPSATSHAATACSGVEMPTPISTGRSVTAFSRRPTSIAVDASSSRSPVTPSSPTPYTKPRGRSAMRASRSSGEVGAASSTVSTPAASAARAHGPTSSSGRSGRIAPATPAPASSSAQRWWPQRKTRL